MSGLTRADLRLPRAGKKYPYRQQTDHYPGVDTNFVYERGGALRVPGYTDRVTDLPGDKSSYAWPTNTAGLAAFRQPIVDNSTFSESRHWRTWPQTKPFMATPFEQPDSMYQ